MGAFDLVWDLSQSGRIAVLEDEVETLEKEVKDLNSKIEEMSTWIRMLKEQIDGKRKEGKPNETTSVVETPTRLETNILEK